jgi:HAD superfamily hydrolase (TIGR01459 family)
MDIRRIAGLAGLADRYDGVLCDVWGVMHNGVQVYRPAVEALQRFRATRGPVVLISNAPRPSGPVEKQMDSFGVPRDAYDRLVTSGDVTRTIMAERPGAKVLHLGPDRDMSFYEGLDIAFADEAQAELISCTGLPDDTCESPEDYRDRLHHLARRGLPMVCANPDVVVERGGELVYCAGALASLYQELGGEAILAGKPFPPIYEAALQSMAGIDRSRVLAIGDALATDLRGAQEARLDALFVTGGIHAGEFGPPGEPDARAIARRLAEERLKVIGYMPALAWRETTAAA